MITPFEVATGSKGSYLKISGRITPDIYINDIRLSDGFMAFPDLSEEAIFGVTTLN